MRQGLESETSYFREILCNYSLKKPCKNIFAYLGTIMKPHTFEFQSLQKSWLSRIVKLGEK